MSGAIDLALVERARAVDCVGLIGRAVALRKGGRTHAGLCPFHNEKTPSFTVWPDHWHCYGCGAHGDAIGFVMRHERRGFADAVAALAGAGGAAITRRAQVGGAAMRAAAEEDLRQRTLSAQEIWHACRPAQGTPVETYLAARGIRVALPPTLRFHPRLWHGPSQRHWPAMVAAVQDVERGLVGVHRTFLAPDGRAKAPVQPAKMMLGRSAGCCVRFAVPAPTLLLAEGIETALSALQATGAAVWAALSLGNFLAVELPQSVRRVVILADQDEKDLAAAAALRARAAERLWRQGRTVRIARPPKGQDFNDVLRSGAAPGRRGAA